MPDWLTLSEPPISLSTQSCCEFLKVPTDSCRGELFLHGFWAAWLRAVLPDQHFHWKFRWNYYDFVVLPILFVQHCGEKAELPLQVDFIQKFEVEVKQVSGIAILCHLSRTLASHQYLRVACLPSWPLRQSNDRIYGRRIFNICRGICNTNDSGVKSGNFSSIALSRSALTSL